MALLCIIALLASNIWLMRKLWSKPDNQTPPPDSHSESKPEQETSEPHKESQPKVKSSIIGESKLDDDFINSLIDKKVKEEVARVFTEYTNREDVKIEDDSDDVQVPNEKLDEVFTHKTVSEADGDAPRPEDPHEDGQDFKAIEAAVRCAKDEPHTEEEAKEAKVTLAGLHGTQIEERISLDDTVKTRIMTLIFSDSEEPVTAESLADKKKVHSKTVDTRDVDEIKINILT